MSSERKKITLGELGRVVTGKTPLTSVADNFGGDVPFVTPSDMDGRKTISSTLRSLTEKGAASVKGSRIPVSAVMVSCIGSDMGKAAVAGRECVTNQQINSIIVADEFCCEYVYYDLSTRKAELQHIASGAAQPILNKGHFSEVKITLPPLSEQKRTARILGALDDKIDLNRRMNATLEAMAQALFQSWFVDFDPVRRNAEGGETRPEDSLFPDSFEDSEMGEIPKGWKVMPLYETAIYRNGAPFKPADFCPSVDGLPVVKIAELKSGLSEQTKWSNKQLGSDQMIDTGDLLYSWSGSPDTSLDAFLWSNGPGLVNQHIFKVITSSDAEKRLVFYLLKHLRPILVETARDKQTTGLGHVTVADMKRLQVCRPPKDVLAVFDRLIAPIFDKAFANTIESQTLATLRDALLPKLLSGEFSTNHRS